MMQGETKNTYGTGCFMLYNTGQDIIHSSHGLLTTLAYQQEGQPPSYALEGSVAVAGLGLRWLRDNMGMIKDYEEAFELASQVSLNLNKRLGRFSSLECSMMFFFYQALALSLKCKCTG